ncbi:MAG: tetratricopeptide repeat protein [Pseudomonadota bacterium]
MWKTVQLCATRPVPALAGMALTLGATTAGPAGSEEIACEAKDHTQTIAQCTRVIESARTSKREVYKALLARSEALHETGRLRDAVVDYSRLIQMYPDTNPGMTALLTLRGHLLHELDRYDEAIADFDRVLAEIPADHEVRIARAFAHHADDQLNDALADWTYLIENAPDGDEYRSGRVGVYLDLGLTAEAFRDAKALLQSKPDDPLAHMSMGTVYAVIGDAEAAYRHLLEFPSGENPDRVITWQKDLAMHGHYDGPKDGVISPSFEDALRACLAASPCRRFGF